MTDAQRFENITDGMLDVFEKKNHDYGSAFAETFKTFGPMAGVVTIAHKYNRLVTLVKGYKPKVDESMEDTLIDMANYCIMLKMEIDKQKETL